MSKVQDIKLEGCPTKDDRDNEKNTEPELSMCASCFTKWWLGFENK